MKDMSDILAKVLNRLKSSRVWAVAAGNVVGIEAVHGDWPRACVIIAVNGLYIISQTWLKMHPPISLPAPPAPPPATP